MGSILLIGSIYDGRVRCLPVWLLVVGLLGSMVIGICSAFGGQLAWWELVTGLLPGAFFLVLAAVTREQIGYGDGLVLLMLGLILGLKRAIAVSLLALLGTFAVSVMMLLLRKAGKKTRLPFVPFLCAGFLAVLGLEWRSLW